MTLYPAAINDPYMDGTARLAALALTVNVADEASVRAMFKDVAESSGGLDLGAALMRFWTLINPA